MKVKDITRALEQWAPPSYQESYDNSGLIVGEPEQEIHQVLISLDVTEEVIEEAVNMGAQLIVAHHPLIFGGVKRISSGHWVGRCLQMAIKNDISIYAIHTNLDNVYTGVNRMLAERIGLTDLSILAPRRNTLEKLVTFLPENASERVQKALFEAGAGRIGEYDQCSFVTVGTGSFRPSQHANPTIGTPGKTEKVSESRVEVLVPAHLQGEILSALFQAHPYEEVAYYLTPLDNMNQTVGAGMFGKVAEEKDFGVFLADLKESMNLVTLKHTKLVHERVQKVAVCGGAGRFLLKDAINSGAQVFITSDFKYHDFFEANNRIVIVDIGHYESEVYTKDLIGNYLRQKFTNIAFHLTRVDTNPISYL